MIQYNMIRYDMKRCDMIYEENNEMKLSDLLEMR